MAGILVQNVGKTYSLDEERSRVALQNVDLEVSDGEFVCLLGPSGCGKTTLLNILSGLDREYQGTVRFTRPEPDLTGATGGQPVIGYMFQESRLLPWMTVKENIRFVLDGRVARDAPSRIDGWLKRVGLSDYGDYYPLQLSIGMQQRVAVARALIIEPELLFMDEPFSSLDELTALRMRGELLDLWMEQACTVVFVTHNPLEAVYLADRVLIMTPGPGRIVEEIRLDTLPRPRDPEDRRLWEISRRVVSKLMGKSYGEARPEVPY